MERESKSLKIAKIKRWIGVKRVLKGKDISILEYSSERREVSMRNEMEMGRIHEIIEDG